MSPIETYSYLRQAGFSHDEARRFINQGVAPNCNTEMKRKAVARLASPTPPRKGR